MAQQLIELVEQFCTYQRKRRGRTEGGVKTYRWNLEQFLGFVRRRAGRIPRLTDLTTPTTQGCLDDMAAGDLGVNTMRSRVSTLSSPMTCATAQGLAPTLRRSIAERFDRDLDDSMRSTSTSFGAPAGGIA